MLPSVSMSDPETLQPAGTLFFKTFDPPLALHDGCEVEVEARRLSDGRLLQVAVMIVDRTRHEDLKTRAESAAEQLLEEVFELSVMGIEFSAWCASACRRGLLRTGKWLRRS